MRVPWRSAETVPARFRAADPSVRRSFVAALWAARGWETWIDGQRVLARNHPNWGDEALWIPARRSAPRAAPSGVDAVVTTGSSAVASVRTITPDDLQRMALYAGDRAAAEEACRRHLGVELRPDPEPTPTGAPLAEIGLAAVAAVVVLAAVFGVVGTAPDASTTPPDEPASTSVDDSDRRTFAPGVTEEGLRDPSALASAHARAVDRNRPYVWELTYEEYNASERMEPLLAHDETVWVVDDERYRVDKDILYGGRVPKIGPLLISNRAYADGTHRYVRYRLGGHAEFERFPVGVDGVGAERFSTRSAELLTVLLDTNESWIRPVEINGEPYLQLYGSGTTRFDVARYRAVAFLTETGFVRELSVTFHEPETDTVVVFTYEYRPFTGTLVPPPWAGEAENVTVAGGDGIVVPSSPTETPMGPNTIAPPDATIPTSTEPTPNGTETSTDRTDSG